VEDVCFGESNQFTDLSTVIPQNETITTYKWLFGDGTSSSEQNPLHTYNTAGSYEVSLMTYTAQGQCERKITKEVSVKPLPIVNAGEDQTILDSWTALLKGSVEGGSGDYSFQWTPANQLADPSNLLTNTLKLNATTHFTLTVTDNDGGCVSEDEVVIYFAYVFLPNAFKPNSNIESNQLLKPIGALEAIKNFEFLIYSRWGQLVFKTNSSKEGWDGTFNGKSLPAATYVWLMRYEIIENSFLAPGEILKRGTVNLVP
ncbi:MAG: gliding motility-associated C-terminal domain-containing protein, partial [Bacteroidales bacterium]|nr:gliding motility-associated C-terminal domain-containing protein [Bacteroidales bacterium]